jgi:NosR/NirI family nitrous oxide reductase transcriptional regulator
MHCQELYHDDHRCPHMIQVRLKRERFEALSSPNMRGVKDGSSKPARLPSAQKGKPAQTTAAKSDPPSIT